MISNLMVPNKKSQLLMLLHEKGPISQASAARRLNVSAAAVNMHVKSLKETGLLQEKAGNASVAVGRPGQLLSINKTRNLTVSIVVDAPICTVGLADFAGSFLESRTIDLEEFTERSEFLEKAFQHVSDYIGYSRENGYKVRFACVACPGLLDFRTGKVLKSVNIPMLEGIDFESELRQRFGIDSHVISEGIAHFWGEFDGTVNDSGCMMVNWGVGVGCIIGHGNRVTYPSPLVSGMRGDIGHVVVEPEGRMCKCGRKGCLEAYAGGAAMMNRLRETDKTKYGCITYKQLIEAVRGGDATVLRMIEDAARMIGEVLAWPTMLMGVEQIRLAGDLGTLEDIAIRSFKEGMSRRMHKDSVESMKIESSHTSQKSLMAGAHALAAKFYFDDSILQSIRLES